MSPRWCSPLSLTRLQELSPTAAALPPQNPSVLAYTSLGTHLLAKMGHTKAHGARHRRWGPSTAQCSRRNLGEEGIKPATYRRPRQLSTLPCAPQWQNRVTPPLLGYSTCTDAVPAHKTVHTSFPPTQQSPFNASAPRCPPRPAPPPSRWGCHTCAPAAGRGAAWGRA